MHLKMRMKWYPPFIRIFFYAFTECYLLAMAAAPGFGQLAWLAAQEVAAQGGVVAGGP